MIDNIKISVGETLDIGIIKSSQFVSQWRYNEYWLYNTYGDHHLTIEIMREKVIIEGSWRKWYFGNNSFEDLTSYLILKIAKEISKLTGLSLKAILDSKILKMEFGATFWIPIYPSTILNSMFRYSNFELLQTDTSISFRAEDYWLGLYDKTIEVNRNKKGKGGNPMNRNAGNPLRIEIKAFKQTAFRNKLRSVKTIRDVLMSYRLLIVSFLEEIKRIEMRPINLTVDNVSFKGKKKKDLRQHLIFLGIAKKGFGIHGLP